MAFWCACLWETLDYPKGAPKDPPELATPNAPESASPNVPESAPQASSGEGAAYKKGSLKGMPAELGCSHFPVSGV